MQVRSNQLAPVIVAHRGLHNAHPENSLVAFRAAWDAGIDWCECDVWRPAAGEAVVLHDETLDRTTTGRGPVRSLQLDDSRQALRLKMPDGRVTEEPLPSLPDLLSAMKDDARLLVEIKPPNARSLVHAAIDGVGTDGAVQSFDLSNVEYALSHSDPCPVLWLIDQASQFDEVPRLRCNGIGADFNLLNAETVAFLRRMKKRVAAWTVNQEDDIVRMLALGIDVIITDEPLLARRIVQRL